MLNYNTRVRLGDQLAKARRRKQWTQRDLARRSTQPASRLSLIESGKANTTIDTIAEIGEAVGLSLVFVPKERLADVLTFIGQPEPKTPLPTEVGSAYEDVFIPDPTEDEEESRHGSP
jgi:transcriptional regulator with XRE-family HTH domain